MGKVLKPVSKISGLYGQPGEEKVSEILAEKLSDAYIILNSPRIYFQGSTYDMDHIVIGPTGIFVIETKNMQGMISGGMMGNWTQERTRSSHGQNQIVKIGNPASQVKQYSKVVKSHLSNLLAKDIEDDLKVYPIVVFAHDDVVFGKMDFTKPGYIGRVKVIKSDELINFINNREAASYDPEFVDKLSELIVPVNQREQTAYFSLDNLQSYSDDKSSRYEIFEELGRGSFGAVYRGFDYKMDTEIAVKKINLQNKKDPKALARFYREAQISSGLSHENIVGVYDFFVKDNEYFIIMELVDGVTLDQYVEEKHPSINAALKMYRDICSALVYAHENQVIHRDLKPSNILVDSDNKIKVTDFGIAKLLNSTSLTVEDSGAGTPIIMSPEQISGGTITEKSDIFSLGILLYFLVTGRMPFDGDHIGEIVHKISHLEPIQPSQLNNEISTDLESVILRALEKREEDRFDSVEELKQCIDEIINTGKLSVGVGPKSWLKYIPRSLRPLVKTEARIYALITVFSLLIFLGIMGLQSYKDSKALSQRNPVLTNQYGFTNQNIKAVFSDPLAYIGLPVNIVGKIEKVTKMGADSTEFILSVTDGTAKPKTIDVIFNQPHFALPTTTTVEVDGSIQEASGGGNNRKSVIIAEKIQPVKDPWSILSPSRFTVYPNKTVTQNGKLVELEKVEFSDDETRLYVRIANVGFTNDVVIINNPIAKQGIGTFIELPSKYGVKTQYVIQLQPHQETKQVIFLEPMQKTQKTAKFILGSTNDELLGQQPYVFDISW